MVVRDSEAESIPSIRSGLMQLGENSDREFDSVTLSNSLHVGHKSTYKGKSERRERPIIEDSCEGS